MKKQGVLHIVLGLIVLLRWPNDRLLFGAQLRTYTWTNARTNLNGLQRIWLHHWKRQLDRLALQNTFNAQHITRSYKVLTPEVFPSSLWKHNTGAFFGYARGNVSLSMRNPLISKRTRSEGFPPASTMVILKNIPRILSPQLLSVLARMGHGDEIGKQAMLSSCSDNKDSSA